MTNSIEDSFKRGIPKPEVEVLDIDLNHERKSVPLPATTGQEVQNAKLVFIPSITKIFAPAFAEEGAKDEPTPEVMVNIEDLTRESAEFQQMFDEDGKIKKSEKFFTRSQITEFCRTNQSLIRKGGRSTLFPMEHFVAFVRFTDEGQLIIFASQWAYDQIRGDHRVVWPQ